MVFKEFGNSDLIAFMKTEPSTLLIKMGLLRHDVTSMLTYTAA